MIILPLADRPDLVPTIGQWHWQEWGHADPEGSLASWTQGIAQRVERDGIPTTFVALSDTGELLGSVTLVDCDMSTRSDLWPWLAGLYVAPGARDAGVGSALVAHVTGFAANLAIDNLYLYTATAERLYARLGWEVIDRDIYEGDAVAIMRIAPGA